MRKRLVSMASVWAVIFAAVLVTSPVAQAAPGDYSVPSEIAPGNYWAKQYLYSDVGYVRVCSDEACDPATGGIIQFYLVKGPTWIVVPENAVLVRTMFARLQPAGT